MRPFKKRQILPAMLTFTMLLTSACGQSAAETSTRETPAATTAAETGDSHFDEYIKQIGKEIENANSNSDTITISSAKQQEYLAKLEEFSENDLSDSQLQTREILVDYFTRELALIDAKEVKDRVKDGDKKYYAALLSEKTGTDLSPKEAITALEEEVSETTALIQELLAKNDDLASDYISALPLLTDPEAVIEELKTDTLIYFPEIEDVDYEIQEMPSDVSDNTLIASYQKPSLHQKEANIIYINSLQLDSDQLFSTLAHETYPGHMYQTNYALQQDFYDVRYLLTCDGYDEGWAMYAQFSSYDYLEFQDVDEDTTKNLRLLYKYNDLLNTYLSSLSDLYVNYEGYSEENLAQYLSLYNISEDQASSTYQYVTDHVGTYLSYGLGYYEFTQLEEKARQEQGSHFDLKTFHQQLLDTGSCSFPILEKSILSE